MPADVDAMLALRLVRALFLSSSVVANAFARSCSVPTQILVLRHTKQLRFILGASLELWLLMVLIAHFRS